MAVEKNVVVPNHLHDSPIPVLDISEKRRIEEERLEMVARAEAEQRHRAEEAECDRKHQELFIGILSLPLFCAAFQHSH